MDDDKSENNIEFFSRQETLLDEACQSINNAFSTADSDKNCDQIDDTSKSNSALLETKALSVRKLEDKFALKEPLDESKREEHSSHEPDPVQPNSSPNSENPSINNSNSHLGSILDEKSVEHCLKTKPGFVYGELIVLGCSDSFGSGNKSSHSRHSYKYVLKCREKANGVKLPNARKLPTVSEKITHLNHSRVCFYSGPNKLDILCWTQHRTEKFIIRHPAVTCRKTYAVSYTLERGSHHVVPYDSDSNLDMFQIGRSTDPEIDFVVKETVEASKRIIGESAGASTISRYAARITVQRNPPHEARIYAAGFDPHRNIFLGERANKWYDHDTSTYDGITTNGLLIRHPCTGHEFVSNTTTEDSSLSENTAPTEEEEKRWKEVSVCGHILPCRHGNKNKTIDFREYLRNHPEYRTVGNILKDGTLIDLCGVTLLYRSGPSIQKSYLTMDELNEQVISLNRGKPQCPVNLNTLAFPKFKKDTISHDIKLNEGALNGTKEDSFPISHNVVFDSLTQMMHPNAQDVNTDDNAKRSQNIDSYPHLGSSLLRVPHIYHTCGHVHGNWNKFKNGSIQKCPVCRQEGLFGQIQMSREPNFFYGKDPLTHVFSPCGHLASFKTVKYWSDIFIPYYMDVQECTFARVCPFCYTRLDSIRPYVRLILQDYTGYESLSNSIVTP